MAVEAPISRYKKNNLRILIVLCVVAATIFAYDGYLSKYKWSKRYSFYKENVIDNNGKPTSTMNFNRKSPLFFIGTAVLLGAYLFAIKNKKIIAAENELVVSNKEYIPYDFIEKIDKTHFDSKGYFVITYKNKNGNQVSCKLSDRIYDNLSAVIDELVAKIS